MDMETQKREPQMGLTFEKVWAALMELRESQRESQQETERLMREAQQETARVVKETSKSVGGLQNSLGELTEHLVAPNVGEKL